MLLCTRSAHSRDFLCLGLSSTLLPPSTTVSTAIRPAAQSKRSSMTRAASSERTPLLPPGAHHGEIPPLRRLGIALPYLLVFLAFEISVSLVAIPISPIQEAIICRKHYADVVSADPRCKNEIVQSELSMLKGWEVTFGLIPGMVTVVPYGIAADKYGRRLVLGLSLLGLTLSQAADIIICTSRHCALLDLQMTNVLTKQVVFPTSFPSA